MLNKKLVNRHLVLRLGWNLRHSCKETLTGFWRDRVETLPEASERFFAGVPKVPAKSKDKMAIYELFVQHIIYSLKPDGQAAVVLPTGFITAQSGIDKTIRQHLVDNQMLAGVVSMPSNIFATTGTNVSILFIDKKNKGVLTMLC